MISLYLQFNFLFIQFNFIEFLRFADIKLQERMQIFEMYRTRTLSRPEDHVQPAELFGPLLSNANTLLCEVRSSLEKVLSQKELNHLPVLTYKAPYEMCITSNYKYHELSELQQFEHLLKYMNENIKLMKKAIQEESQEVSQKQYQEESEEESAEEFQETQTLDS